MSDTLDRRREFYTDYYRHLDSLPGPATEESLQTFLDRHTDDVVVQYASWPRLSGRSAFESVLRWTPRSPVLRSRHNIRTVVPAGDSTLFEFVIDYTLASGSQISIPCASVLRLDGDRIAELRIYLDPSPLMP